MADRPRRVQLKRVKGWRMPENTVKVDRSTPWGNPYRVEDIPHFRGHEARRIAVDWFRDAVESEAILDIIYHRWTDCTPYHQYATLEGWLKPLRGKNLACWCHLCDEHKDGKPLGVECDECASCHADVLLGLANRDR